VDLSLVSNMDLLSSGAAVVAGETAANDRGGARQKVAVDVSSVDSVSWTTRRTFGFRSSFAFAVGLFGSVAASGARLRMRLSSSTSRSSVADTGWVPRGVDSPNRRNSSRSERHHVFEEHN